MMRTAAWCSAIAHPSFRKASCERSPLAVRRVYPLLVRVGGPIGRMIERDDPLDDRTRDVRHRAEPLVVGQDLLRERDERASPFAVR